MSECSRCYGEKQSNIRALGSVRGFKAPLIKLHLSRDPQEVNFQTAKQNKQKRNKLFYSFTPFWLTYSWNCFKIALWKGTLILLYYY